jgi:dTDP-4-amino-4,6-dideoxygalactose transaminase
MRLYEARFAAIFGGNYHAFAFWKARVALYAILKALGLKEGDEVLLPGYTCVVVPHAVQYAGAKPVYADIISGHYNLDFNSVAQRITPRTRALIIQHTYGMSTDCESLAAIARQYRLYIVEDCAHVLVGTTHRSRLLGSFGKAAFFSSQWSKPYTTGLGGMVVTQDKELAGRLKQIQNAFWEPPLRQRLQLQIQYLLYRTFFGPRAYWFCQRSLHLLSKMGLFVGSSSSDELIGAIPADLRWRMSEFQARAGLAQIEKTDVNAMHRRRLTKYYSESFHQHRWPVDDDLDSDETTLLRYPLQVMNKSNILEQSRRMQIELGSWFETPLHPLPLDYHHKVAYQLGTCPIAESTAAKVINLPLHERVSQAEAERIVDFVLSHASPA